MHLPAHLVRGLLDHHEDFPEAGAEQQPALRVTPGSRRHDEDCCAAVPWEACQQVRLLDLPSCAPALVVSQVSSALCPHERLRGRN